MNLTDYLMGLGMAEDRIGHWMAERYHCLNYWLEDFRQAYPDQSITLVDEHGYPMTGHVRQDADKLIFVMHGLYEGWL